MQKYARCIFFDRENNIINHNNFPYDGDFEKFKEWFFNQYGDGYIIDSYIEDDKSLEFSFIRENNLSRRVLKVRIEVIN